MLILQILIKDIAAPPGVKDDLMSLSPAEAAERIRAYYEFLSPNVEVEVADGLATISVRDEGQVPPESIEPLFENAVRSAQRGEYSEAIRLFRDVLRLAPAHLDARRNLGMALFEMGRTDDALNEFIDVLRQDPKDVWTLVLVANLFFKDKKDLEAAERYYRSALDVNPDDQYARANYGALLAQSGRIDEARQGLRRVIEQYPEYHCCPNVSQTKSTG